MPIEVAYGDEFYRAAKKLKKRYPHVIDDAEQLADELEAGQRPGDRIQGLEIELGVYKVRIANSDAQRGKSGGYRVIYYFETAEQIVIVTIYSKSDAEDIPVNKLRQFINEYKAQNPPKAEE